MSAARYFYKAYSPKMLNQIYKEKIQYRASAGMDNITPKVFGAHLTENIQIISKKVLAGTYNFTRYREILISKGRGKEPRVISIPTIRDKLALAAYHTFLQNVFADTIEEPLLHTIVGSISQSVLRGQYNGYVKIDITKFYSSINHSILLRKIKRKVRKKEALEFLARAITTQTIPRNVSAPEKTSPTKGVPEGLSISNILADIYLSNLKELICNKFDIAFFRYVDDILILCQADQAAKIKDYAVNILIQEFALEANPQKTVSGKLNEGVPFLGYVFYNNKISIRPAAKQKIESSLEELFRKRKNQVVPQALFIWRLNLRISGCILESKKYGWLFYYSQMSDLKILFQLDWLIQRFFKRFKIDQPDSIKSFVRTYHEITKNVSHSTYLINADLYSCEEKRKILSGIYSQKSVNTMDDDMIESLFKEAMFKEIQRLEHDIQNFCRAEISSVVGRMNISPLSALMPRGSPSFTRSVISPAPRIVGIPRLRAKIAVWEVSPPFSVTIASTISLFSVAVSEGDKSSATITAGTVMSPRERTRVPERQRRIRFRISSMSAARSRVKSFSAFRKTSI